HEHLGGVRDHLGDFGDVTVLPVSFARPDAVAAQREDFGWPWPVASDSARKLYRAFGLGMLPWWRTFSPRTWGNAPALVPAVAERALGGALRGVGEVRRQPRDRLLRALDVPADDVEDGGDVHLVVRAPAVVVGGERERGVRELRLAGEERLGHVGHPDHVGPP